MFRGNLLWIVYLVIGVVIAADRDYLQGINTIEEVVEALLAVLLWPLLLFGVSLRI